ncbi:hypothetical protein AOA80_03265 [Methanomassiliicoccales archaeon RumEn M1]|jgi:hypothetical protein|nr:hypothetical protein AOA80_03265 [Methanomassiliicoccales archaeon RumEn M1]
MIASLRTITYEDLKGIIGKEDGIAIWSCDTCAKGCHGFGGEDSLRDLASCLRADGFDVRKEELMVASCYYDGIRSRKERWIVAGDYDNIDVIIPLACQEARVAMAELFPDKMIIDDSRTAGLGVLDENGVCILTDPFEWTGLDASDEGIDLPSVAEKLGMFTGPF